VKRNTAVRWFCGFSLYEDTPDHSYFGKLRKRVETEKLIDIFNQVIAGLVEADGLLAKVAIHDADNLSVEDLKLRKNIERQIAMAKEQLARAQEELAKNRPDKAIIRFALSWLHAQLAVKFAGL